LLPDMQAHRLFLLGSAARFLCANQALIEELSQ
jgi:hypothetical protein